MLSINKVELNRKYIEGDMNYFFKEATKITDFILSSTYKVYDEEKRMDMTQECMLNLWGKIQKGKIDGSKNLMSFIWQNSTFRILEIFRKEKRRAEIAQFISTDEQETDWLEKIMAENSKQINFEDDSLL